MIWWVCIFSFHKINSLFSSSKILNEATETGHIGNSHIHSGQTGRMLEFPRGRHFEMAHAKQRTNKIIAIDHIDELMCGKIHTHTHTQTHTQTALHNQNKNQNCSKKKQSSITNCYFGSQLFIEVYNICVYFNSRGEIHAFFFILFSLLAGWLVGRLVCVLYFVKSAHIGRKKKWNDFGLAWLLTRLLFTRLQ